MEMRGTGEQPSLPIHHQLLEIWRRILINDIFAIDESFFNLGGDSPKLRQMLDEVERCTGAAINTDDFLANPTIKHLSDCLLRDAVTDSLFVSIQQGRNRLPFYFFHGDILGAGFYSKRLATLLGKDQPVHISPPIELNENELPPVEELAARKRRALQLRQPHGPYLLGGFCVGAVVAYEVARQLRQAGEEVSALILIEPEIGDIVSRSQLRVVDCLAARQHRAKDKVDALLRRLQKIERLRHVWRSPWRERTAFVVNNTKKLFGKQPVANGSIDAPPPTGSFDTPGNRGWLLRAYRWVLTSYVPKRYSGPITMLLTKEQFEQAPFILKQWQRVAPQVRVDRIPGGHLSCITTHLQDIAVKIRREINTAVSCVMMLTPAMSWPLLWLD